MNTFQYEQVRANGLSFRVATAGTGKKLALCLHGFPEFSYSWRHQLPMLAQLGYRAWAPDLRGFGGTDAPKGVRNYRMKHLVADVAGLIDASQTEEVVLLAHDWGAFIAWSLAMQKARPLKKLIILNVPHPGAMQRAMGSLRRGTLNTRQLRRSTYMFVFQIPFLPERLATAGHAKVFGWAFRKMIPDKTLLTDEDIAAYRDNACRPGRMTCMMNYYRAMLRYDAAQMGRGGYPTIETPTLMLWGTADTALGVESTYETGRFVKDLTLRYLPGISHLVQQQAPHTVNAMIGAFLKDRPVPFAADAGPQSEARTGGVNP